MDGKRLCCLFIPDFPLQILQREAGLSGSEAAMVVSPPRDDAAPSRIKIVAANPAALEAGVKLGAALVDGQLACPDVVVLDLDEGRCQTVADELLSDLCGRFPTIEAQGDHWFIGTRGMGLLYPDEGRLIDSALAIPQRHGFCGWAAIAPNRFTALAAARAAAAGLVPEHPAHIAAGAEASFLSPLPLHFLPEAHRLIEQLAPLGIYTMGQLANLPPEAVERRYGTSGLTLHRLARGEDSDHISAQRAPQAWRDHLDLEHPISAASGLIFLIAPMVEHLVRTLSREGRACSVIDLTLGLEDRSQIALPLSIAAPTEQPRVVIDLFRLKLAKTSLTSGVTSLTLDIRRATAPARGQESLFDRSRSGVGLAATLERLRAAFSQEAITVATLSDNYCPAHRYDYHPPTIDQTPGEPKLRPISNPSGAFRRLPTPRPITALPIDAATPERVQVKGRTTAVIETMGPLAFDGGWWASGAFSRRYFRLLLESGAEILVYRDGAQQRWFLEGVYD